MLKIGTQTQQDSLQWSKNAKKEIDQQDKEVKESHSELKENMAQRHQVNVKDLVRIIEEDMKAN